MYGLRDRRPKSDLLLGRPGSSSILREITLRIDDEFSILFFVIFSFRMTRRLIVSKVKAAWLALQKIRICCEEIYDLVR